MNTSRWWLFFGLVHLPVASVRKIHVALVELG
jgi:hypothetical protein